MLDAFLIYKEETRFYHLTFNQVVPGSSPGWLMKLNPPKVLILQAFRGIFHVLKYFKINQNDYSISIAKVVHYSKIIAGE